ncbi:hypothetical protein RO3G_06804 [Rhizopus delemar RA 99-880]|uniref:Uncharacterized protein n=1 Tax=Rhizopus delemar (strain RA 99-880 / ATCC MYA-4621 / FGSC 9543 / NRRL 43880) TaxID=246409 RepID=I1C0W9_RHIO9|nr:hypothetical protein RO3G_06804 [Rhizopus delemar RA 99-880]|eukprot:EIE82099.1 hypothetical protein RO3G_06804 [Rhizopus delemar RA 99-880]
MASFNDKIYEKLIIISSVFPRIGICEERKVVLWENHATLPIGNHATTHNHLFGYNSLLNQVPFY